MGRNPIIIDKDELKDAIEQYNTQNEIADYFECSQGTISNKINEYGLGAKPKNKTPRNERLEHPKYTWEEAKDILYDLEEKTDESIGYKEVEIEIDTKLPIMIIGVADTHLGARHVYYRRMFKTCEDIKKPQIFCTLNGDFADNYNTSAYKSGQIEQTIKIQKQKALVETIVKELSPHSLGIINGCHDEWSYLNDGFDFAQFLSSKSNSYFMGHKGIINLKVGDIEYKIFICHNTYRNSTLNPGHGLGSVAKEGIDFDLGISAHTHQPHAEYRVIRGELKVLNICGAFKGIDRHGSKSGFPPLLQCTPGTILYPREKKLITSINYRQIMDYL